CPFEMTYLFFFFQAEDGIRDFHVTGVQTCALPILPAVARTRVGSSSGAGPEGATGAEVTVSVNAGRDPRRAQRVRDAVAALLERSEERRVGKECTDRCALYLVETNT